METNVITDNKAARTHLLNKDFYAMNFWKLWSANSFSNLGDGLYQVTLPLLAAQLTRSPSQVAGVNILLSLPWLIFALPAGSIVDRVDRRKVMLWVNAGRLLILITFTLVLLSKQASLPLLYTAALLLGIGETLMDTSLTSIVPALVPKDRLSWANARIAAAQNVANTFIGPPLAGYLAGIGFALATGSSTLMYAVAALALLRMRGTFRAVPQADVQADPAWWQSVTEGLRYLWKDPLIRSLTLFTASMNLFWAGWASLIVLYAVKPGPMGLDKFAYGLLLTAMAAGGLLGALLCERIQRSVGMRNALVLDFVGTILLVGMPALTTNAWLVGGAAFLAGIGASVWVILVASIRQRITPNGLLGRLYSASRFISWGVGPLGAAVAGFVAEMWGMRTLFALGGIISVGLLLLFIRTLPAQAFDFLDEHE